MKSKDTAISPTRKENYQDWYLEVIKAAGLAENSPTRGSMIIKPWGYSLWENIQSVLDGFFKETGHENAYFPLLIPLRFFQKEAEHVEGFAKECAVVTHHKLEMDDAGKLVPAGPLEELYIIRPTSETIIGDAFSRWVQSYRDLPLLINQWANVMRWEMRPRLFLRTAEFLWQEGHTVHSTSAEAVEETLQMLDIYEKFAKEYLAIPVIKGQKTPDEKFPGADTTYTIEGMMQDGKALQCGTSHFLGQNFAKASEIKFITEEGREEFAWTTSWGVSTRLIGGMIMTHSDDDGLVLPPRIAPVQVVILPMYKNQDDKPRVMEYAQALLQEINSTSYFGGKIRARIDTKEMKGGDKFWNNVKKGIPVRIEIGSREMDQNVLSVGRRDLPARDRLKISKEEFIAQLPQMLEDIHQSIYGKALANLELNTKVIDSFDSFVAYFKDSENSGFASCYGSIESVDQEELQKTLKDLKVSPRCIPLATIEDKGTCIFTGKANQPRIIYARSY
ncbi:MAG: proline--tRNA ligase [Ignavibacteria bacterium]|nr:proline--tRNA ligase [Ignavibacteria bacterium]